MKRFLLIRYCEPETDLVTVAQIENSKLDEFLFELPEESEIISVMHVQQTEHTETVILRHQRIQKEKKRSEAQDAGQ